MKKVLGIIPARLHSKRLPHKMLISIKGKPLIYHTWNRARKARLLDEVLVATDSQKIYQTVINFGGRAMMTSPTHRSGSDRVADAANRFRDFKPDIVVNIQGDQPLVSVKAIDKVIEVLQRSKDCAMATAATPFDQEEKAKDPSSVKVIYDKNSRALYFSRSIIPYARNPYRRYLKHIGIYAFRRDFLSRFIHLPSTPLERAESLEQLRVLEHGYSIAIAIGNFDCFSVDTEEDLKLVCQLIKYSKHEKK